MKSDDSSVDSDSSRSAEQKPIKIGLKIKHKNRVKKIPALPPKFEKLNNIVMRKYEEFKKGKETYTMCYLDEEDELINISDEEDYAMFKQHVRETDLITAKVFLTKRGEEGNFNPMIDDAQTVNESVIMDEDYSRLQMMRSTLNNPGLFNTNNLSQELLEQIKSKLDMLVTEQNKPKTKLKCKKKKSEKKEKKEKKSKIVKGEKAAKKKKVEEKEVKLKRESSVDSIEEVKMIKENSAKLENKPNEQIVVKKGIAVEAPKASPETPYVRIDTESDEDSFENDQQDGKHEFGIQPAFKRKEDQKVLAKRLACSECEESLDNKVTYICTICPEYCL